MRVKQRKKMCIFMIITLVLLMFVLPTSAKQTSQQTGEVVVTVTDNRDDSGGTTTADKNRGLPTPIPEKEGSKVFESEIVEIINTQSGSYPQELPATGSDNNLMIFIVFLVMVSIYLIHKVLTYITNYKGKMG